MGEYRRNMCGKLKDADWFDATNEEAVAMRNLVYRTAINDMVEFLQANSHGVAILDTTAPTHEKRLQIYKTVKYDIHSDCFNPFFH